jgi:hypothetical protein
VTDQHPLTDEIIHREFLPKYCYTENDLRLVADWQFEKVTEWLQGNLGFGFYLERHWDGVSEVDVDYVIEDLRKAMRPTTTQEDN